MTLHGGFVAFAHGSERGGDHSGSALSDPPGGRLSAQRAGHFSTARRCAGPGAIATMRAERTGAENESWDWPRDGRPQRAPEQGAGDGRRLAAFGCPPATQQRDSRWGHTEPCAASPSLVLVLSASCTLGTAVPELLPQPLTHGTRDDPLTALAVLNDRHADPWLAHQRPQSVGRHPEQLGQLGRTSSSSWPTTSTGMVAHGITARPTRSAASRIGRPAGI